MSASCFAVTTSWDDGHPADVRLAELLARYGISGTFYIPNRNSEGRPVMNAAGIRQIASRFEIGGHSIDHEIMTVMHPDEIARQLRENKGDLEQMISAPVRGFCYVRGRHNRLLRKVVQDVGYRYARTTENFHVRPKSNAFEMPTTIQIYPHKKIDYVKNYLRNPLHAERGRLFCAAITHRDLSERIDKALLFSQRHGVLFHLWGHSWEIDALNLWVTLEGVFAALAEKRGSAKFVTNYEALFDL